MKNGTKARPKKRVRLRSMAFLKYGHIDPRSPISFGSHKYEICRKRKAV